MSCGGKVAILKGPAGRENALELPLSRTCSRRHPFLRNPSRATTGGSVLRLLCQVQAHNSPQAARRPQQAPQMQAGLAEGRGSPSRAGRAPAGQTGARLSCAARGPQRTEKRMREATACPDEREKHQRHRCFDFIIIHKEKYSTPVPNDCISQGNSN